MSSTPHGKATESDDVSIVPVDEKNVHAYEQVASADYQITRTDEQRVSKYTSDPKAIETNDVLIARADERFAGIYEHLARADEQFARLTEQLSRLGHDAAHHRSAVPGQLPPRGGSALRGIIGLLVATCIFAAAFVSQSPDSGAAKQMITRWAGLAAQPSSSPSAPQVIAAEPVHRASSAQTEPQGLGPTAAPLSDETAQRLETMASDLAKVEREIEQLKTSQEQMARDNARAIEQLKASQEQTVRDNASAVEQLKASREQIANFIAGVSRQDLQAKATAPPSRPTATLTRKRVPTRPSPQTGAQP